MYFVNLHMLFSNGCLYATLIRTNNEVINNFRSALRVPTVTFERPVHNESTNKLVEYGGDTPSSNDYYSTRSSGSNTGTHLMPFR